jgi:hypothetical protein
MSNETSLTTTLQALVDEEQVRVAGARDRLGTFVPLVQEGIELLNTCVATIDPDHFMAAALMFAVQKAATLSFLSYIRGHVAQAEFNMRQTIEFTALTAYMLAHPEEDITKGPENSAAGLQPPKAVSGKAYRWLDKQHGHLSALLKEMKGQINDTTAHASIYLTHFTFDWKIGGYDREVFRGSFFDNIEEDVSRLHLMSLARLLVLVVEVIRKVSDTHGGFTLNNSAVDELHRLDRRVNAHRDALAARMGMSDILKR